MKVMVTPGATAVAEGVAVTTRSAIVTTMEVDAVPSASSRTVTETEYCPPAVYECVAGVPTLEESSPNLQMYVMLPVPPVVRAENVNDVPGAAAIRFTVAMSERAGATETTISEDARWLALSVTVHVTTFDPGFEYVWTAV